MKNNFNNLFTKLKIFYKKCDWGLLAVIFVGGIVYLTTLSHSMYIEDSPEYITAAATLGIPHPSGYPLYVLLGKLFSYIPLYNIPWRINLMSAVFAIGAGAFLYLTIKKITNQKAIPALAVLTLLFSEIFWSQSIITEVYTIFAFFLAVCLWLLVLWQKSGRDDYLLWLALAGGLGISVHLLMGINLFFLGAYIIWAKPQILKNWRLLVKMLLLFLLGLLPYIYLPWRSLMEPVLDFGNPETWQNFWNHISRQRYDDYNFSEKIPIKSVGNLVFFVSVFLYFINQFNYVLVLFAFIGWVWWWRQDKKNSVLFSLLFFANTFLIIILRKYLWTEVAENIYRVYYFGGLMVFVIWLSLGIGFVYRRLFAFIYRLKSTDYFKKSAVVLFSLILFLMPAGKLFYNYEYLDFTDYDFSEKYLETLLDSLPPRAVLIEGFEYSYTQDSVVFGLLFYQFVKEYRPDVSIYSVSALWQPNFNYLKSEMSEYSSKKQALLYYIWESEEFAGRPVFTTFFVNPENDLGLCSRSNGIVNKVYFSCSEAAGDELPLAFTEVENFYQGSNESFLSNDFASRDMISYLYYQLSMSYFEQGDKDKAARLYQQALHWDPNKDSHFAKAYDAHQQAWQEENK